MHHMPISEGTRLFLSGNSAQKPAQMLFYTTGVFLPTKVFTSKHVTEDQNQIIDFLCSKYHK